jgi:predicted  nucleic acid-binding Zn-ribbon protein
MKIVQKSIITGILLGMVALTTNASAASIDSLTKASVKLIQLNNENNVRINNINDILEKQDSTDKELSEKISSNLDEINSLKTLTQTNNESISFNSDKLNSLETKLAETASKADKAAIMSSNTKKIVDELTKVSQNVKKTSSIVYESNKEIGETFDKVSSDIEKNSAVLNSNTSSILEVKNDVAENNNSISSLNTKVADLEKVVNDNKIVSEGHYKELKEEIKTMKLLYDAEIKILKAKLDRAKPIIINSAPKRKIEGLKDPNTTCAGELSESDEEILKGFLQ